MFFGEKKRQYTERQLNFMEALRDPSNKGNLRECMKIAGYATTAPTSEIIKALKKEILEIAEELLALSAPAAALKLGSTMSEEALEPGIKEKLSAANSILDRVGIVKTERIQVDNVPSRIMLLPARKKSDADE